MKKTVLIVDDEPELGHLIRERLATFGVKAEVAGSGEAAIEMLKRSRFDLVLTDMRMPHMSGLDLMVKVRGEIKNPPEFFIMTGFPDVSKEELREKGALCIYQKPGDFSTMVADIAKYVAETSSTEEERA